MIVAPDSGWSIASDILADPVLAAAVHVIGCHYPGTHSSSQAEQTMKPLWASEDDSTYNNDVGAECWARVINQNYVNGNMTASFNWNLLAAYMKGTQWYRAGLMNAMQPWNGAYGAYNAVSNLIYLSILMTGCSNPPPPLSSTLGWILDCRADDLGNSAHDSVLHPWFMGLPPR